jgi:hypothetical protein
MFSRQGAKMPGKNPDLRQAAVRESMSRSFFVIPAKAGIRNTNSLDRGFRRGDDVFRSSRYIALRSSHPGEG